MPPKKKPAAKRAVADAATSGAIRLEFHGYGGEYMISRATPEREQEARKLATENDLRDLFCSYDDDLFHTSGVDIDDCIIACIDEHGSRDLDLGDVERKRDAVDGHEMPPPNLRYLVVTEHAKGYFGCVHLSTDGTFDPKKLVLRYADLEEWGTDGNVLMGIEYDGTAYAIDSGDHSTRGTDSATAFVVQYGKHAIESIDEITDEQITDEDDD